MFEVCSPIKTQEHRRGRCGARVGTDIGRAWIVCDGNGCEHRLPSGGTVQRALVALNITVEEDATATMGETSHTGWVLDSDEEEMAPVWKKIRIQMGKRNG